MNDKTNTLIPFKNYTENIENTMFLKPLDIDNEISVMNLGQLIKRLSGAVFNDDEEVDYFEFFGHYNHKQRRFICDLLKWLIQLIKYEENIEVKKGYYPLRIHLPNKHTLVVRIPRTLGASNRFELQKEMDKFYDVMLFEIEHENWFRNGMNSYEKLSIHIAKNYGIFISISKLEGKVNDWIKRQEYLWKNFVFPKKIKFMSTDCVFVNTNSHVYFERKKPNLFGIAITDNDEKIVLKPIIFETENLAAYDAYFKMLKDNGVEEIELVITDNIKGIASIISKYFSKAKHQNCLVHLNRKVIRVLKKDKILWSRVKHDDIYMIMKSDSNANLIDWLITNNASKKIIDEISKLTCDPSFYTAHGIKFESKFDFWTNNMIESQNSFFNIFKYKAHFKNSDNLQNRIMLMLYGDQFYSY